MSRVRFTAPFDWTPPARPSVTIAYPVGEFTVTRDCAAKAVKAGAAVRVKPPKRGQHAHSGQNAGAPEVPAANDH